MFPSHTRGTDKSRFSFGSVEQQINTQGAKRQINYREEGENYGRTSEEEKENTRSKRVARIDCFCFNGLSVTFG